MQISYNIMTGPSQTTLARSVILSQTNFELDVWRLFLRQMEEERPKTISWDIFLPRCNQI